MNMIWLSVPLLQSDALLSAEVPKNLTDLFTTFPQEHFLTVLWYDHDVVLTIPLHMRLTLPVLHGDPPWPLRGLPWEDRLVFTQEMAEPLQFSPAELVDYL
jgi:hypothetical protein